MAKRIKDFANIIKNESFEKVSNQKVSLLFDSAKNWSKNYQAVICRSNEELLLLSLKITDNNKAETITPMIIEIIEELKRHNSIVISYAWTTTTQTRAFLIMIKELFKKLLVTILFGSHAALILQT